MFFYGVPSQLKALVDRSQAMWSKRRLEKTPEQLKRYDGGRGYLIAVGATKGKTLFDGSQMMAKYFYDALDMRYEGGRFYAGVEARGSITNRPEALQEAFDLGAQAAKGL
jgi:multimeric flavodoxin WrbA